jgi:hypothetical protein
MAVSKAWTKGTVEHFRPRGDGLRGCNTCGEVATRWMDFAHNGNPRFLRTAYCAGHGSDELNDPATTETPIRARPRRAAPQPTGEDR